MANYRYTATVYDFGRDMYGNPTAHYQVRDHRTGKVVAETGKRRQQIGYDGTSAEGALDALQRATGESFDVVPLAGNRPGNWVKVAFRKRRKRKA